MADLGRRGSENRQRQKLVGVRMTPAEHAALVAAAKRERKSEASVLRDAFLESEWQREILLARLKESADVT